MLSVNSLCQNIFFQSSESESLESTSEDKVGCASTRFYCPVLLLSGVWLHFDYIISALHFDFNSSLLHMNNNNSIKGYKSTKFKEVNVSIGQDII